MEPIRIEKARIGSGSTWLEGAPCCLLGHVMAHFGMPVGTWIGNTTEPALEFLHDGPFPSRAWFRAAHFNDNDEVMEAVAVLREHGLPVELI